MEISSARQKAGRAAFLIAKMGLAPSALYFLCFCFISFPVIRFFPTHFFSNRGDGLVHAWNLWWVSKAVTELHQSPWFTAHLHFPHGTTLLGHALNPLSGFLAMPLLRVMTLHQAYNVLIIFCFVTSGLAAFLLAYRFTRSYWGSFAAGFIFTFSSYHLTHARGHLELAATQWIPLFLLAWYALITKPRIGAAVASALVLSLAFFCTPYYFLYCVIGALVSLAWLVVATKDLRRLLSRQYVSSLLAFLGTAFVTMAPFIFALLLSNRKDPLTGFFNPKTYSLDLLGPFIPGGRWRFAYLTKGYWSRLPGNIGESTVHIGLSVTFLVACVWTQRRKLRDQAVGLWFSLVFVFGILALGPVLQIWGKEIPFIRLPYALLELLLPPIRLSGSPVRMMVMVSLGVGVISAYGLPLLAKRLGAKAPLVILPLLSLLAIEYLPWPMFATRVEVPRHVRVLRDLPSKGGVLDLWEPTKFCCCEALYHQTIHGKPIAFGYISRVPQSVVEKDRQISRLISDGDYQTLHNDYGFEYLVSQSSLDHSSLRLIYSDERAYLYQLGP